MSTLTDAAKKLRGVFDAFEDEIARAINTEAAVTLEAMNGEHFFPYVSNKNPSDTRLQGRSWQFQTSLRQVTSREEDEVLASFFLDPSASESTNIAAMVSEFGSDDPLIAPIVPKRSEKMNIPVGPALDSNGVRKYATTKDAARDWVLVWFDDEILGRRRGTDDELVKLYERRDKVDVPARPVARPELEHMLDRVLQRVEQMMAQVVN